MEIILIEIIKNYSSTINNIDDILYDFSVCLCIMYREGDEWYFTHNIFQEFYAAYFVYKELDEENVPKFFHKISLRNSSRFLETTLDYYGQLDDRESENKLQETVIFPILDQIQKQPNFKNYLEEYNDTFVLLILKGTKQISISPRSRINGKDFLLLYFIDIFVKKTDNSIQLRTGHTIENIHELKTLMDEVKFLLKQNIFTSSLLKSLSLKVIADKKPEGVIYAALSQEEIRSQKQLSKFFNQFKLKEYFDQLNTFHQELELDIKEKRDKQNLDLEDI